MDITIVLIVGGIALAVVFCLFLAIANFAPARFFDIYNQINEIKVYGTYVSDFLNDINQTQFNPLLKVHRIEEQAADAYVRGGFLLLSNDTLSKNSVASFAVLAHELGHALQDRDSKKLKHKSILLRIGMIIGPLMFPSLILGLVFIGIGKNLFYYGIGLTALGVSIFLLALIIRLFTISIEKDASKKAVSLLEDYLDKNQIKQAKKLLKSAKLTYWAKFFQTLLAWTFLARKTSLFN